MGLIDPGCGSGADVSGYGSLPLVPVPSMSNVEKNTKDYFTFFVSFFLTHSFFLYSVMEELS
jgi:hypothetical protein